MANEEAPLPRYRPSSDESLISSEVEDFAVALFETLARFRLKEIITMPPFETPRVLE